jgi:holo-[acyl-carrier-protein] synthase
MIRGLGIDLCEIARMEAICKRFGEKLLRVFDDGEWDDCRERPASLAARWAAKEAFVKALGTGFRTLKHRDVAVRSDERGRPFLVLKGRALTLFEEKGGGRLHLSLSHEKQQALACVIWEENSKSDS